MADNVTLPGTGTVVAADDISSVWYQRVKLVDGTADSSAVIPGSAERGLTVDPRPLVARIQVTPTITNGAYTSGDCVGGLMTITGAARANGGTGTLLSLVVLDKTQAQRAPMDLLFFDSAVTSAGDNAPVAFSDGDMAHLLGIVPLPLYNAAWPGTPLNSVSAVHGIYMAYVLDGGTSDLYCQAVLRSGPTYTSTSDLIFSFTVQKD